MDPSLMPRQTDFGGADPVPTIGERMIGPPPPGYTYRPQAQQGAEDTTPQLNQTAIPVPVVREEYPPVVVLKSGGAYSVIKYWVKNGNLYYVTTQGENGFVPLAMVKQIYPRERNGQMTAE